jgi:predicted transcriptional regulator
VDEGLSREKTLTVKILEFVRDNPSVSVKEVAEFFNISQDLARAILLKLRNKGFVRKEGKGFFITEKGEWLLGRGETSRQEPGEKEVSEAPQAQPGLSEEPSAGGRSVEERLRDLEARVKLIEEKLRGVEEALSRISGVSGQSPSEKPGTRLEAGGGKAAGKPPKPVMSLQEAVNQFPGFLEQWKIEGVVVQIGGLIVERNFLVDFMKKFPIPVDKVEELQPMEKAVFDELRREALIILHGGKEYKIVKNIV